MAAVYASDGGGTHRPCVDTARSVAPSPPAVALPAKVTFVDPDPFQTLAFPNVIAAKRAVADEIGMALAKLAPDDRAFIDALVRETLARDVVLARVRAYFKQRTGGGERC